jgi:hypothetical protein
MVMSDVPPPWFAGAVRDFSSVDTADAFPACSGAPRMSDDFSCLLWGVFPLTQYQPQHTTATTTTTTTAATATTTAITTTALATTLFARIFITEHHFCNFQYTSELLRASRDVFSQNLFLTTWLASRVCSWDIFRSKSDDSFLGVSKT